MERPLETEKLLLKNGVVFERYILSDQRQKSEKILVKNFEKCQFSIEVLIKNSKYSKNFKNFGLFWSKHAKC